MEFLVDVRVSLPPEMAAEQRQQLLAAELKRGRELVAAGHIQGIWRIPGAVRNVGIWNARDATELHQLIASLPLFPWLAADVTALATHPLNA
ncbi:muconolactone Delta-isomerase [Conexibacter woesei]|uniref:Muconolactone Delta-isomerase n=1 Tax=Conexibacter woesei (strain DSM 14684 / CCUG 47730 / CIP 108061 / JCM 11494 / NBRC 100937 / ID131577) TaxID=469383 RepID=D3F6M4_CONWI|nr:muconolactone Delta-isomerase family protein [Conexibacter woesei]ADB50791.1 Muconolactone delta-isomerase [Conexibacter woesei DSM 14684]